MTNFRKIKKENKELKTIMCNLISEKEDKELIKKIRGLGKKQYILDLIDYDNRNI